MRRWFFVLWLMLGAVLLASCSPDEQVTPATKAGTIRAVIVGIDDYQFSRAHRSAADFNNLKGAVFDAQRFGAAMAELYGVNVAKLSGADCEAANGDPVTLINQCATRGRILAALDQQIATLEPGDTLLFYFAGHGAQFRDDERFDQDSGFNATILPHDARNPDGSKGDIFDTELKAIKDRAAAKGLYFVSIFDSCNSATATRTGASGQSRNAPPLTGSQVPETRATAPTGAGEGYWVHLAAAQDGEEAQEVPSGTIGKREGVFTTALIEALRMPNMRRATFGDIIAEVQLRVAQKGHFAQNPSAEGALTAAFGAREGTAILFAAEREGADIVLKAGAASGITVGSTFAFYASEADALRRTGQLAKGTVIAVDRNSARVAAKLAEGADLPANLAAEEIAHFVAADSVAVSNQLPSGAARDAVAAALARIPFAALRDNGAVLLALKDPSSSAIAMRAADGTLLSDSLGNPDDPAFAARLEGELTKIARVQQLLALRTDMQSTGAANDTANIAFCVAGTGYRVTACPQIEGGGLRRLDTGQNVTFTVRNDGGEALYIYVLAIDPRNAVQQILPRPNEIDAKIRPGEDYRRDASGFRTPGTYRFITIATDQKIRADALVQSGNGTRDIAACRSPLERLLCSANDGTRDPQVSSIGNWSVSVSSAIVAE